MKTLIIRILVSALAIGIAAYLVPNVTIDGYRTAIVVAVVLALVNGIVGGILRLLTLPLNILTLGLVSFLIGVFMILLVDKIVDGFETGGFITTAIFAIVLSLINMLFGVEKK